MAWFPSHHKEVEFIRGALIISSTQKYIWFPEWNTSKKLQANQSGSKIKIQWCSKAKYQNTNKGIIKKKTPLPSYISEWGLSRSTTIFLKYPVTTSPKFMVLCLKIKGWGIDFLFKFWQWRRESLSKPKLSLLSPARTSLCTVNSRSFNLAEIMMCYSLNAKTNKKKCNIQSCTISQLNDMT